MSRCGMRSPNRITRAAKAAEDMTASRVTLNRRYTVFEAADQFAYLPP